MHAPSAVYSVPLFLSDSRSFAASTAEVTTGSHDEVEIHNNLDFTPSIDRLDWKISGSTQTTGKYSIFFRDVRFPLLYKHKPNGPRALPLYSPTASRHFYFLSAQILLINV